MPPDFMPRQGGEAMVRRIERLALEEAVTIVRRARAAGPPATLYVAVSRATLVDATVHRQDGGAARGQPRRLPRAGADHRRDGLDATCRSTRRPRSPPSSRRASGSVADRRALAAPRFRRTGGRGGALGARSMPGSFITAPESLTDFHTADIAAYVRRFGIDLDRHRHPYARNRCWSCSRTASRWRRGRISAVRARRARSHRRPQPAPKRPRAAGLRPGVRTRRTAMPEPAGAVAGLSEIADRYDASAVRRLGRRAQRRRGLSERGRGAGRYRRKAGGRVVLITNAPRPSPPIVAMLDRLGVPRERLRPRSFRRATPRA